MNIIKFILLPLTKNKTIKEIEPFDTTPDMPKQFGYKISWLVIKTNNIEKVLNNIDKKNISVANWNSGIDAVYSKNHMFITPVINNCVCIIANSFTCQSKFFKEITTQFEEVFLCSSNRIIDLYSWKKYKNGKLIRNYYFYVDEGLIISDGKLTQEEINLNFDKFAQNIDELFSTENINSPDEDDVIKISKEWGFDPSFKNNSFKPSTGYVYPSNLINEPKNNK